MGSGFQGFRVKGLNGRRWGLGRAEPGTQGEICRPNAATGVGWVGGWGEGGGQVVANARGTCFACPAGTHARTHARTHMAHARTHTNTRSRAEKAHTCGRTHTLRPRARARPPHTRARLLKGGPRRGLLGDAGHEEVVEVRRAGGGHAYGGGAADGPPRRAARLDLRDVSPVEELQQHHAKAAPGWAGRGGGFGFGGWGRLGVWGLALGDVRPCNTAAPAALLLTPKLQVGAGGGGGGGVYIAVEDGRKREGSECRAPASLPLPPLPPSPPPPRESSSSVVPTACVNAPPHTHTHLAAQPLAPICRRCPPTHPPALPPTPPRPAAPPKPECRPPWPVAPAHL